MNKEFFKTVTGLKLSIGIFMMICQMIENLKRCFKNFITNHFIKAGIPEIPIVIRMRYAESRRDFFKREIAGNQEGAIALCELPFKYLTQFSCFKVRSQVEEVLSK